MLKWIVFAVLWITGLFFGDALAASKMGGAGSFVKDQAILLELEYKTDVDKGLIRERGRVEVRKSS